MGGTGLSKSEFNDKFTLSFSSSMSKKNEKFSSKSTESRKTTSWLQSMFRFWFPGTLANNFGETHLEAGGAGGSVMLLSVFAGWAQAL